jgi:DNA mismatch repair protein MutS2
VTLEAGTMRVSAPVEDLEPAEVSAGSTPGARGRPPSSAAATESGTNVAELRRGKSVPLALDLRGARVDEALAALDGYLNDASVAGLDRVTVIHGSGTGALRDAVRAESSGHPLVKAVRAGERGEGGDGVTVVSLG